MLGQTAKQTNKLVTAFAIFMFGGTTSVGFLVHASRATAQSGKEEHVSFAIATKLNIVRPSHHNIVLSIPWIQC